MPSFFTAKELAGADTIPDLYKVTKHLVFSSPATLAYNSPGAEGFGVKRAGLSIPESVMLIVSPGCCGSFAFFVNSVSLCAETRRCSNNRWPTGTHADVRHRPGNKDDQACARPIF